MMGVLGWVAAIVVGLILGWAVSRYAIGGRQFPGNLPGSLVTGVVGGVLGAWIPGNWGWTLDGANMIAAILASAVLTWLVGYFGGKEESKSAGTSS
ncbi:hypothetical protein [Thermaerobacter litoralis]|mgnify:CR=1 FL=1